MKLRDWLSEQDIGRSAFARRIGVSPGYVSRLCDDDDPVVPSGRVAARIEQETSGAVTANDFVTSAAA